MKLRTALWTLLLICSAFAYAQTLPLAVAPAASSGLPGWVWGGIMLAGISGGLYLYLKKKNPAAAATVNADAAKAGSAVVAEFKAIADRFHAHVEQANANTAAAIAKIPTVTARPATPAPVPAPTPVAAIAPADSAGTVIAPAPITTGAPSVRDPFVIGPQVVAWALRQSDNFDVTTSAGAHPEIGIAGCDAITNYLCANPSFTIDAAGFEAAYQKTKSAPPAQPVNPPLPLTPEVQAKLIVYTTKCLRDCDKIGYLKLPGNSDLFNYMTTNGLFTSAWFVSADYATTSGTYDPVSKTQVTLPRVWE